MSTAVEYQQGDYVISTDKTRLDQERIYQFLSQEAYWALDMPRPVFDRLIEHSLCFGVYAGTAQAGFARVLTDYATFAYIDDVFVLPEYRGQGLSKWLITSILAHPELQNLRRWVLLTRDAHELYRTYGGFNALANPDRYLERVNLNAYQELKAKYDAEG